MKRLIAIVAVAWLMILCGCAPAEEMCNDTDTVKIGFIPETMTVERWQRDRDIFVAKAKELGANTTNRIDAIVAANDRVAEGAINALSENRLAGKVFVTGQDAELAACQRIVEGTQNMTVYKPISVLAEGAAEIAVKMASGQDIGEFATMSDGTYDIKYHYYEPIAVTTNNMFETVIKDGFYTVEQVYANVPGSEWPQS